MPLSVNQSKIYFLLVKLLKRLLKRSIRPPTSQRLLLTGVERVALATYVHGEVFRQCSFNLVYVTA